MPGKGGARVTKGSGKVSIKLGGGKIKKKWCSGKIWFTDEGCIYVDDPSLADAILRNYLTTGKLCVTIPDEFSPSYETNVLCKC